jgi:hypothetical protein
LQKKNVGRQNMKSGQPVDDINEFARHVVLDESLIAMRHNLANLLLTAEASSSIKWDVSIKRLELTP